MQERPKPQPNKQHQATHNLETTKPANELQHNTQNQKPHTKHSPENFAIVTQTPQVPVLYQSTTVKPIYKPHSRNLENPKTENPETQQFKKPRDYR